jgi:hypothetical protein
MRRCFIGLEFTHDKLQPRAVVRVKTRFGPIKRWVDEHKPEMVGGQLRERVALLMPLGFRFRKDEIHKRIVGRDAMKWADGKMLCAMMHAERKYDPHVKTPRVKKLDAAQVGVGVDKTETVDDPKIGADGGVLVPGDGAATTNAVAGPETGEKIDEGSVQAG